MQVKLLRVLQERMVDPVGSSRPVEVDVRVIAATHQDLDARVREGRFREDLYHRLNVIRIRLPALRERREDIPELVRHFVSLFARRFGKVIDTIPTEAMAALGRYPWPGNVRELEHLIERAVILAVGSELLGAERVDTNSLAMTAALNRYGIELAWKAVA